MVTLGKLYMTEVPQKVKVWMAKDNAALENVPGDDLKKVTDSVVDGLTHTGRMLILLGIAKEYKAYFEFKDNATLTSKAFTYVRLSGLLG